MKPSTLPYPNNVGKRPTITDMHGKTIGFTIVEEIFRPETGLEHEKLLCLQRIQWEDGRYALRMAYYMLTTRKKTGTQFWCWGQFCTFICTEDWQYLIIKAKEKGWYD